MGGGGGLKDMLSSNVLKRRQYFVYLYCVEGEARKAVTQIFETIMDVFVIKTIFLNKEEYFSHFWGNYDLKLKFLKSLTCDKHPIVKVIFRREIWCKVKIYPQI